VTLAQPHDRTLPELLFDLSNGEVNRFEPFLSFIRCHVRESFRARYGREAPDRLLILETVQAKVKRRTAPVNVIYACIYNELRAEPDFRPA
jgi:hypothetical protein